MPWVFMSQESEFPVVILPITSASRRAGAKSHLHSHYTCQSKLTTRRIYKPSTSTTIGTSENLSDWTLQWSENKKKSKCCLWNSHIKCLEQPYIPTEENQSELPAMIGIARHRPQRFLKIGQKTHQLVEFLFIKDYFTVAACNQFNSFLIVIS